MASNIARKKVAFSILRSIIPIGSLVPEVEIHKSNDGGKRTHQQEHEPAPRSSSSSISEGIFRFENFRGHCVPDPEVRAPTEALPQHPINVLRFDPVHCSSHQQCPNLFLVVVCELKSQYRWLCARWKMKGDHAQRFSARRQVLSLNVSLQDRNWSLPLRRYACGFLVPKLGIHERVERLRVMHA